MPGQRTRLFVLAILTIGPTFCIASFGTPAIASSDADISGIRTAAEHGTVQDEIALADAYFMGRGVPQDVKLAAFWYEKAAGAGDPMAQNQIGYFYESGLGVPVDGARAAHWFQLAAAGGYLEAKVNLAVAYLWGVGVPANSQLAEQLMREAAGKGSGDASTYLGDMYFYGFGVAQDKIVAEGWYEKGVKRHNCLAGFRLGTILSSPANHPPDIQRSVALYRESASAGFVPAMHSLALILLNHPEITSTPAETMSLLNQAADAGMWRSSVVLGILHRDGKMTAKDAEKAYFHFQIANRQGGEEAQASLRNDLKALGQKLDENTRTRLDTEVNTWMNTHKVALEFIYKNGEHLPHFPAFGLAASVPHAHAGALVPTNPF